MTMANERTRSLRWAHEVLNEISGDESIEDSGRASATAALRIFPSPAAVSGWIEADVTCIESDAADAIEQAGKLLRSIRLSDSCSEQLRRSITYVLRHYPQPEEAKRWTRSSTARSIRYWLLPEDV